MIKVNSKVIIKGLVIEGESTIKNAAQKLRANIELRVTDSPNKYLPPIMIVESITAYRATCLWYNVNNELQSKDIRLELLTEL